MVTNQGMPRMAGNHKKLDGRHGMDSLQSLQRSMADLDFRLLNTERINFYYFKPLGLWQFVRRVSGNEYYIIYRVHRDDQNL